MKKNMIVQSSVSKMDISVTGADDNLIINGAFLKGFPLCNSGSLMKACSVTLSIVYHI